MLNLFLFVIMGRASLAMNCEARLAPRVALAAMLIVNTPARAADEVLPMCQPVINPDFPREVDVRFPDKIVRIVGHFHPSRGNGAYTFESYLDSIFDSNIPISVIDKKAMRQRLDEYLSGEVEPIHYWREDLDRLDGLSSQVDTAFIEYDQGAFQKIEEQNDHRFERGQKLLTAMNYSPAEVKDVLTMAITPAYYLRHTLPEFEAKIATAEGTPAEAKEFEAQHCGYQSVEVRESSLYGRVMMLKDSLERVQLSLVDRGVPPSPRIMEQLQSGMRAAAARATIGHSTEDDLVNAFTERSKYAFSPSDLQVIRAAIAMKPWEDLSMTEILRRLPEDIVTYRGCDGRNGIIARNLARRPGDSAIFMGIAHLAPVSAILARTCRARSR